MVYKTFTGRNAPFYTLDRESAEIVNLAIALGRPLLVEGEAGCGKTRLASAIAYELELDKPIYAPVRSTSQAKDLLYRYDALRRLQDTQNPALRETARHVYPYIRLQPLGRAILKEAPAVILIDEVDKADIDFPNDLLDVLDMFTFPIEELPEDEYVTFFSENGRSPADPNLRPLRPIVIITSNREKPLPEPFLRRCLYLELRFPDQPELLAEIVRQNLREEAGKITKDLLGAAVASFLLLRQEAFDRGAKKPPATSELIDWVKVLLWRDVQPEALQNQAGRPAYFQLLLKTMHDKRLFEGEHSGASS